MQMNYFEVQWSQLSAGDIKKNNKNKKITTLKNQLWKLQKLEIWSSLFEISHGEHFAKKIPYCLKFKSTWRTSAQKVTSPFWIPLFINFDLIASSLRSFKNYYYYYYYYYSKITNLQANLCLYESLLLIKIYWQILPRFIQFVYK